MGNRGAAAGVGAFGGGPDELEDFRRVVCGRRFDEAVLATNVGFLDFGFADEDASPDLPSADGRS